MRIRSFVTTLGCAALLVGVGAGTAFADGATASARPTAAPSAAGGSPATAAPTPAPAGGSGVKAASPVPTPAHGSSGSQVSAMPSGAPDTGVPPVASGSGFGAADTGAVVGAGVLAVGAGALVVRRRRKAQG